MNFTNQLQTACEVGASLGKYVPPTRRAKLEEQKALIEGHLKKINKALEALDKYPELEDFMNTIEATNI